MIVDYMNRMLFVNHLQSTKLEMCKTGMKMSVFVVLFDLRN